jgi:hypothetical protein
VLSATGSKLEAKNDALSGFRVASCWPLSPLQQQLSLALLQTFELSWRGSFCTEQWPQQRFKGALATGAVVHAGQVCVEHINAQTPGAIVTRSSQTPSATLKTGARSELAI